MIWKRSEPMGRYGRCSVRRSAGRRRRAAGAQRAAQRNGRDGMGGAELRSPPQPYGARSRYSTSDKWDFPLTVANRAPRHGREFGRSGKGGEAVGGVRGEGKGGRGLEGAGGRLHLRDIEDVASRRARERAVRVRPSAVSSTHMRTSPLIVVYIAPARSNCGPVRVGMLVRASERPPESV